MNTGLCLPFTYGGCEGNANNFETIESCYAECGALGPTLPASCSSPFDCTLVPSMCCGGCSEPSLANRVAVRKGQESAVQIATGCHLVDCVPCEPAQPNPWLGATCTAARCVAFDARALDITLCTDTSDCVLRGGLECCENCAAQGLDFVAVNREANVAALTCGDGHGACDACVAVPPFGLVALCESGRCTTGMLTID
jgi:hypothetical protein